MLCFTYSLTWLTENCSVTQLCATIILYRRFKITLFFQLLRVDISTSKYNFAYHLFRAMISDGNNGSGDITPTTTVRQQVVTVISSGVITSSSYQQQQNHKATTTNTGPNHLDPNFWFPLPSDDALTSPWWSSFRKRTMNNEHYLPAAILLCLLLQTLTR